MRHLIIRQRTQRLLLFFILAAVLYLTFRPKIFESPKGFQFGSNLKEQERSILKKDFLIKDKTIRDIPITVYINPLHNRLFVKSRLENITFKENLIHADIFFAADFVRDTGLSGWVVIKNLEVDQKRLLDISSRFELSKNSLKIVSLKFGDSYILSGTIDLTPPNPVDLNLKIKRANIRDLAIIARAKDPGAIFGIMEGEFFIKGPLRDMVSKGTLVGRNGRIGPVTYNLANINFEGFGPILRIVDSRVQQGEGRMALEGLIDLRNIGKKNLYDSVRIGADEGAYLWNGWGVAKKGARELRLEREVSEEFKVSLKTFAQEGLLPDYSRKEDEVRFELGDELIKMKLKEDEEFFGLEKTLKF